MAARPRHRLSRLSARKLPICAAGGSFRCTTPACFVAESPSFEAKPFCARHAAQFAKRHGIEVPS